jgi:hypothetical protein
MAIQANRNSGWSGWKRPDPKIRHAIQNYGWTRTGNRNNRKFKS